MLGHAAGDLVLQAVAARLRTEAGDKAIVARLSGDEFAIAVDCAEVGEPVARFADRITQAFEQPLPAGTRQHWVKLSVGLQFIRRAGIARTTSSATDILRCIGRKQSVAAAM
jgi:diguanylate cyclase (GGDEF)-like protein